MKLQHLLLSLGIAATMTAATPTLATASNQTPVPGPTPSPTPISFSDLPATGDAYPWEGSVQSGSLPAAIVSLNRNLHYALPVVQWHGNGALVIDIALHYNSKGLPSSAISQGWSLSADVEAVQDATSGDVLVICGDGRRIPFARNIDTSFSAPPGVADRLVATANGLIFTQANRDRYAMNSLPGGRYIAASLSDRFGNTALFARNQDGRLATITDDAGRKVAFTYINGRLAVITDPLGRMWQLSYGLAGLQSVQLPAGVTQRVMQFAYSPAGDLESVTDAAGATNSFIYDANHAVLEAISPRGGMTRYQRDGNRLLVTNPLGQTRALTFDAQNRLTLETRPDGTRTAFQWNAANQLISSVDARGAVEQSTWDTSGRRLTRILPDNRKINVLNDTAGNPLQITLASGKILKFTHGAFGERTSMTLPGGQKEVYSYDILGNMTKKVSPLGNGNSVVYDIQGNAIKLTDPLGGVTTAGYDLLGRPVEVRDASGRITRLSYDVASNVNVIEMPGARRWLVSYDANGRRKQVTSPDGTSQGYVYDPDGNLTSFTDAAGNTTTYAYDIGGNLVSRVDATGRMTTYTYDSVGRLVSKVSPLSGVTAYQWSATDELVSILDANGKRMTATYDLCSRQTAITSSDLSVWSRFTYDADDRPVQLVDATGTSKWLYTANGLPYQMSSPGGIVTHTYDADGQLTGTSIGGKTVRYIPNARGDISRFYAPNGSYANAIRDPDGGLSSVQFPDGRSAHWQRDPLSGDVTKLSVRSANGSELLSRSYQYDVNGRLSAMQSPSASITVGRDLMGNINQITRSIGATSLSTSMMFDPIGQLSSIGNGANSTPTVTDAQRRPQRVGEWQISYDQTGNVTQLDSASGGVGYRFQWDASGQLIGIAETGGALRNVNLQYSGNGQWTGVNGVQSAALDAASHTPVLGPSNPNWFTNDQLQFNIDGAGIYHFQVPDPVGNLITIDDVNSAQDVTAALPAQHAAFGGRSGPLGLPFVRFGARWVFLGTGMFLSPDPIESDLSGYTYADNDAFSSADPYGLDKLVFTPIGPGIPTRYGGITQGKLQLLDDKGGIRATWPVNTGGFRSDQTRVPPGKPTRLPRGTYDVTFPRLRNDPPMVRQGFGFSFDLEPKFPTNRSLIRIHPDGNNPGTQGCIGVMGTRSELEKMYRLLSELVRKEDLDLIVK
jgi:YD repeat-containing protein